MKCLGCGSDYVELNQTWSKQGSLQRGRWVPFGAYEEGYKEGYCGSCSSNNNSSNKYYWNTDAQVTPQPPSQLWKKIITKDVPHPFSCQENYGTGMVNPGVGNSSYHMLADTWSKQSPYRS